MSPAACRQVMVTEEGRGCAAALAAIRHAARARKDFHITLNLDNVRADARLCPKVPTGKEKAPGEGGLKSVRPVGGKGGRRYLSTFPQMVGSGRFQNNLSFSLARSAR